MHVLWITEYAKYVGGCEIYILNTVRHLKARGVRSSLLYQPAVGYAATFLQEFDAAFPLIDPVQQATEIGADVIYLHQLADLSFLPDLPQPAYAFIHDYRYLCLRQTKLTTIGRNPCLKASGPRCYPCLGFVNRKRNIREEAEGFRVKLLGELKKEQGALQSLSACVVGSHYMKQHLRQHGFPQDRICRIPLYAEEGLDEPTRVRRKNHLLFAGQLIPSKGVDRLLRALAETRTHSTLTIAGAGPKRLDYEALAKELGLTERVTFTGRLSPQALAEEMQQASCVVHPAQWPETFGLIGPEAMRFGTPVIAYKLGAIPEWLQDGKTGSLIEDTTPSTLAQAIDRLLANEKYLAEMQANARRCYRERYLPKYHIDRLLELFQTRRFTAAGTPELEAKVSKILNQVRALVLKIVPESQIRALLLIGSYGRGEGGGIDRLHNDLDLLLILRHGNCQSIQARLESAMDTLSDEAGVPIEIAVESQFKVSYGPRTLLYHEMQARHHLILGDSKWMHRLPHRRLQDVPASEVHVMLMNRLALCLLNRFTDDPERESVHSVKCLLGIGDALLYFSGHYHWSFAERAKRISYCPVSEQFVEAYQAAIEWRQNPTGEAPCLSCREMLQALRTIERLRVGATDLDQSLSQTLSNGWLCWRRWLQRIRACIKYPQVLVGSTWQAKLGFLLCTPHERLAHLVLPILLNQDPFGQISRFLGSDQALDRAFVSAWSRVTGEPDV